MHREKLQKLCFIFFVLTEFLQMQPLALSATLPDEANLASLTLPQIASMTIKRKFATATTENKPFKSLPQFVGQFPVAQRFNKVAGLFVTLSKNGKTRACWGSVEPHYKDLVEATIKTTMLALSSEYRYPPIRRAEIAALKVQVTVIKKLVPIKSLDGQNPLTQGLMIRNGAKSGVILPGEASDSYYQLMLCKVKARIAPKQNCQLYRIICDVYK